MMTKPDAGSVSGAQASRPSSGRRSVRRTLAGLLAAAVVIGGGAAIGWWRTRPPDGAPGPSDPERRDARPW
jgi:hypothetical protein